MTTHIDLNCDMGESFGVWTMGADADVMPWITSANIACGFHAGDPLTMRTTVTAAAEAGVAIGAHVGLPDRVGFGRRAMAVSAADVYAMTVVQLGALMAMARTVGAEVAHLKPHGALYHMADETPALAEALAAAVRDVDASVRMVGRAGGGLLSAARATGLATAAEAFIDRRYRADGHLVPRSDANAVIDAVDEALRQAVLLAREGAVIAGNGQRLTLHADTLCIHGDRDDAATFARAIHEGLRAASVDLRCL